MSTYWLTFRIHENSGYSSRYDALMDSLRSHATSWWLESTSFVLFSTANNIDQVASSVKAALDPSIDLALIGMPDFKSARVIGASTDPDLFKLMPFTKKA